MEDKTLDRRGLIQRAGTFGLGVLGTAGIASALQRRQGALAMPASRSDGAIEELFATTCNVTPTSITGPFYLNLGLVRQDITEGTPGLLTRIFFKIVRASDCTPIEGAAFDMWHCDHSGTYSGFASRGTPGQTWLRGIQFSDPEGRAEFLTVYPGWYQGRTTHIHLKVRPTATTEVTTQLYFREGFNNRVAAIPPYSAHGPSPTTNATDNFYIQQNTMRVIIPAAGYPPVWTGITIAVNM